MQDLAQLLDVFTNLNNARKMHALAIPSRNNTLIRIFVSVVDRRDVCLCAMNYGESGAPSLIDFHRVRDKLSDCVPVRDFKMPRNIRDAIVPDLAL